MQNINIRQNLEVYSIAIIGIIGFIFALWWNYSHPHLTVKYDCSISEISPDYPVAVKEGCRKLRARNILQSPK